MLKSFARPFPAERCQQLQVELQQVGEWACHWRVARFVWMFVNCLCHFWMFECLSYWEGKRWMGLKHNSRVHDTWIFASPHSSSFKNSRQARNSVSAQALQLESSHSDIGGPFWQGFDMLYSLHLGTKIPPQEVWLSLGCYLVLCVSMFGKLHNMLLNLMPLPRHWSNTNLHDKKSCFSMTEAFPKLLIWNHKLSPNIPTVTMWLFEIARPTPWKIYVMFEGGRLHRFLHKFYRCPPQSPRKSDLRTLCFVTKKSDSKVAVQG